MFSKMVFSMVNSQGRRVEVSLFNGGSALDYEIRFPELGAVETRRGSLGRTDSERLSGMLRERGLVPLLRSFSELGMVNEEGDFWSLRLELGYGEVHVISGPELSASALHPLVLDIAQMLDGLFPMTRFIGPSRIDRLEIRFLSDEPGTALGHMLGDDVDCDHTEEVCLDRGTGRLTYSRRFPTQCFRSFLEAWSDDDVRYILDLSTALLKDESLFQDLPLDFDRPLLMYRFTFHDGRKVDVRRPMNLGGVGNTIYGEMLEAVRDTVIRLVFKLGMFDSHYLTGGGQLEDVPFSLRHSE